MTDKMNSNGRVDRQLGMIGSNSAPLLAALALVILIFAYSSYVQADPAGASITFNSTGTSANTTPGNRSDAGGTITTMNLDVTQQNTRWKAYVGNVSGVLTLDDSSGNSIYQWAMSSTDVTGELYVVRNSTIDWSIVNCTNQTVIDLEDTAYGFLTSSVDSVNRTFNETTHPAITVAGRTIAANTCRSTRTYVNDSAQAIATALFPETMFQSVTNNIFVTPLQQNVAGFRNETIVDFQAIVPDDVTASVTTYYFYVEIGA